MPGMGLGKAQRYMRKLTAVRTRANAAYPRKESESKKSDFKYVVCKYST
jgi:hypothetical protein